MFHCHYHHEPSPRTWSSFPLPPWTLTPPAKFRLPQTKLQLELNQNWAVTVTSRICIEFHSPTYLSHNPHKLVSRVQVLTAIRTIVSMPNILNRRGYRSSAYLGWNDLTNWHSLRWRSTNKSTAANISIPIVVQYYSIQNVIHWFWLSTWFRQVIVRVFFSIASSDV